MQLVGDASYRTWALPYVAERQEPGPDGIYPQGPQIDSRNLFRIRLHCQFANPGSHTAIMFLTEGSSERLHVAIQNPNTDVGPLIENLIRPESFPETWYPLFHFRDLPPIFFELDLNYHYLKASQEIIYLDLGALSEPINHASVYYAYGRNFLKFLDLIEKRGLIKTDQRAFVENWQLRPLNSFLLPEAETYLVNFDQLYLPVVPLTSTFLRARLRKEAYYFMLGCSPVYIHFLALINPDRLLWLIDGMIELPMEKLSDYQGLDRIRNSLLKASGTVFRIEADSTLAQHPSPLSEVFYYFGSSRKKIRSLLYPPNQVPPELF